MNELKRHKKSDKIKWIITGVAFVLVFVFLAGLCMQLFAKDDKFKPANWFKKPETEQTTPLPNDTKTENDETASSEFVVTPSTTNNLMSLSVKRMAAQAVTTSANAGIETYATAKATYSLTATIQPSNAPNKLVDYSIAWGEGAEKSETPVTNYASISQTSDGSLTANLNIYEAFGNDTIIVTVTARDGGATASCIIKFVGRPTSLSVAHGLTQKQIGSYSYYAIGANRTYDFDINLSNAFGFVGSKYNDYSVTVRGIGSIVVQDKVVANYGAGATTWDGSSKTVSLSSIQDKFITASIENGKLHLVVKSIVENYYSTMKVSGTNLRYYDYFKSISTTVEDGGSASGGFNIVVTENQSGISQTIYVRIEASVTGLSLNNTYIEV